MRLSPRCIPAASPPYPCRIRAASLPASLPHRCRILAGIPAASLPASSPSVVAVSAPPDRPESLLSRVLRIRLLQQSRGVGVWRRRQWRLRYGLAPTLRDAVSCGCATLLLLVCSSLPAPHRLLLIMFALAGPASVTLLGSALARSLAAISRPVATRPVATRPVATRPVATRHVATRHVATSPFATCHVATRRL